MRRILVVTRNFPPITGGMERLNWHLVDQLSDRFEVRLVAPRGSAARAPGTVMAIEIPLKPLGRFLFRAAGAAARQALTWKPHLVIAGSALTAPMAYLAARLCGAHSLVYVHGLDLVVPNVLYKALWQPVVRRTDRIIANSHATAKLARESGVPEARIETLHPGVEIPAPDPAARKRFRATLGLGDRKVLLSVGRLTARKGLLEFVRDVFPSIAKAYPDVRLVIVGSTPDQALYSKPQTPESIQAAADCAGLGDRLAFLGQISNAKLAEAYFGSDLMIFPVRHIEEDPEGFGMVAVEAAAHGLATVAYATGGTVDSVSDGQSGALVAPGDAPGFTRSVIALLDTPIPPGKCREFALRFAWPMFGVRLAALAESLVAKEGAS